VLIFTRVISLTDQSSFFFR